MSTPKETNLADLLQLVYDPREKYSPETKLKACMAYIITGNHNKAAKVAGIKPTTLRKWKSEAYWWPEVMSVLRKEKQDELDGMMTGIIHQILEILETRLQSPKDIAKSNMKDLTWAFGVLFDKRGMMRGDVGHRSTATTEQQLKDIQSKFEELSKQIHQKMDKIKTPTWGIQTNATRERLSSHETEQKSKEEK